MSVCLKTLHPKPSTIRKQKTSQRKPSQQTQETNPSFCFFVTKNWGKNNARLSKMSMNSVFHLTPSPCRRPSSRLSVKLTSARSGGNPCRSRCAMDLAHVVIQNLVSTWVLLVNILILLFTGYG